MSFKYFNNPDGTQQANMVQDGNSSGYAEQKQNNKNLNK